jgi:hypothetical protein
MSPTARVLVVLLAIFGTATLVVLLDLGSWAIFAVLVLGGVIGYLIAPPRGE